MLGKTFGPIEMFNYIYIFEGWSGWGWGLGELLAQPKIIK